MDHLRMFEQLGNLSGLVKEAQKIQAELKRVQAELAERTVEGSAAGGMVTARVNGQQDLVAITIDPAVVKADDVEMLEDLVVAAVSQAMRKSQEMARQAFAGLTGGLTIPGLT
jgi:DNA-binding YbaB/EbfC family protein